MSEKTPYSSLPQGESESSSRDSAEVEADFYAQQQLHKPSRSSAFLRYAARSLYPLILILAVTASIVAIIALLRAPPESFCTPLPASAYSRLDEPAPPSHNLHAPQPVTHPASAPAAPAPALSAVSSSLQEDGNTALQLPANPFKQPKKATPPADFCGTSPASAKAAGCVFEMSNFAWLHPDCADGALNEEWEDGPYSDELEFWTEYGGKGERVPKHVVAQGETELVWVNVRQHRRHCLFVWAKYQRAAMNSRPLDNWTASIRHTEHCIDLVRDEHYANNAVNSYLKLKYPSCEYML